MPPFPCFLSSCCLTGKVHADLSEFNLLWFVNKVWVIDVSQSVMPTHPNALAFLLRDCYNVTKVSFHTCKQMISILKRDIRSSSKEMEYWE